MTKPINPNVIVPTEFAVSGTKTDFSAEKIQSGFDSIAPDILAGDNLNKFIDDVYKSITYSNAGVQDLYRSAVHYDNIETYNLNSIVFDVDTNDNTLLYRSKVPNNSGNPLNDTNYWENIHLGQAAEDYSLNLLKTIYPVGSIYISTASTCPLSSLFGTWELVSEGRVLQGADSNHAAGTTIAAGLPNVKGSFGGFNYGTSGAYYSSNEDLGLGWDGTAYHLPRKMYFDASRSSSIYRDDVTTVQPPAYVVNIWRRTA